MRTRAVVCVLSLGACLLALPASAQGVLSSLGQLTLDGVSLDDPRVPIIRRVNQARALGHLGDNAAAVSVLTSTLARRPPQLLRDAVLMSLAERRSSLAVPELLRALRARVGSARLVHDALAAIGGAQVTEALLELVKTQRSDRGQRELALSALARVAPTQAAPLLLAALNDQDVAWKAAAFRIAIERPHPLWIEPLAVGLRAAAGSTDTADITWALARAPNGSGMAALLKGVSPTSELPLHHRVALALCVRVHHASIDETTTESALSILRSVPSAALRLELRALALDAVSVDEVKVALQHRDPALQRAGVRAVEWLSLRELQEPPAPNTKAVRVELRRALRASGPSASESRAHAALALARLGDPNAHVPLFVALKDPDSRVRRAAVRGLALLDRDDTRAALLRHAALEIEPEIADLAAAGAAREATALDDPWAKGRELLQVADPVDRQPSALAR